MIYTIKPGVPDRYIGKILLIMRLTTVILIASLMQVSAAGLAQRITINERNVALESVLKEIRKQSGYDFAYDRKIVRQSNPIDIDVNNATMDETLKAVLQNLPLTYTIRGKTVSISKKEEPSFLDRILDRFTDINIRGRVLDEKGQGLAGATVAIKGTNRSVVTGSKGEFALNNVPQTATLVISYIGYKTREVDAYRDGPIVVRLEAGTSDLEEVSVVSTGYQNIPKERATGSFELVDNKTLNLVTGTNILKRLQGNVTGFDFNNQKFATSSSDPNKPGLLSYLTIRGQNTLYGTSSSGSRVLVVVDGIEMIDNGSKYTEDQIGKLNPNDIESITVLKDAAAESVYGSRAANGVIVITTKRSRYNQPLQVSLNTNTTVTEKPDLFYFKRVSTADYIDLQRVLYGKGFYNSALTVPNTNYFTSRTLVPPPTVAEILNQQSRGLISETEANAQLADLASNDVRNDLTKYFLRNASLYSNNLSVGGGTDKISYRFSAGHDKSLNNTITSSQDRLTLRSNLGIKLLKNLEVLTDISYTKTLARDQSGVSVFNESAYGNRVLPYDKLADENGSPLPISKRTGPGSGFRQGYIDTVGKGNLLDMNYRPFQDIHDGYTKTNATDINLNLNAIYKLNDVFSANLIYGYQNTATNSADYQSVNAYYSRYLINYFTSYPTSSTPYQRNLPMGGIYNPTADNLVGHNFRGQLNMNKSWAGKHNISAVAGASIILSNSLTRTDLYYGYDDYSLTYQYNLDYKTPLQVYAPGATRVLGTTSSITTVAMPVGVTDNTINTTKAYFNAAYSYRNLYTLSGSIAKDQSNIFGADANNSFKPYYSSGFRWNIDNEPFYKVSWLPLLSLRTTFGYNGNLNYTYKPNAYLVYDRPSEITGLLYGNVEGGSNSNLRPEKTAQLTFALDFGFKNNRVTGNIEVYQKWNSDLIGNNEIDQTTGFFRANYNTANMKGRGIDLTVHTVNLKTPNLNWNSSFRISHNEVIITKSYIRSDANGTVVVGTSPFGLNVAGAKLAGGNVNSIYAYKWAGLSAVNGAPQGYLNGVPSTNYNGITSGTGSTALDPVVRVGSASPTWYGSLRNSLEYKNFTITASILYKLGYYFRKTPAYSVSYNGSAGSDFVPPAEYYQRWQYPGDERYTNVPAFTYPLNSNADAFYQRAEVNVLKGDHVRLQEVSLFYNFNKRGVLKNTVIYGNVQELGIIWKANKQGIDPDALDLPRPRTYALGLSKTF